MYADLIKHGLLLQYIVIKSLYTKSHTPVPVYAGLLLATITTWINLIKLQHENNCAKQINYSSKVTLL